MAHFAEDYYDMPVDLLPSANFAGRPTSDIDMLPALWTLAAYSYFEKDQVETDISPRLQISTAPQQPQPVVVLEEPCTTTVPLTNDVKISERLSSGVKALDRRRLRKKAQSASPSDIDARASPPFRPRRAGRARLGESNTTTTRKRSKPKEQVESAVVTTKWSRDGRLGPQRALPEPPLAQCGEAISVCAKQRHSSCTHQTTRVLQRAPETPLDVLDTTLSEDKGRTSVPTSPSSMVSTPQELYAIGGGGEGMANETLGSAQLCGARRPNEVAKITLAETRSPSSRSNVGWGNALRPKQHTGDVDVAVGRRIYLPGAMMLAACPAGQRRDSVATTPDASAFDTSLGPSETRYSDLVGLDGIVTFFEDFGVVAEATEATLDRYWLRECRDRGHGSDDIDGSAAGVSSVEDGEVEHEAAEESQAETAAASHWIEGPEGRASTLSRACASCPGAVERTAKRKRSWLKDLLSPGLPGGGSGKTPASWGQQAGG